LCGEPYRRWVVYVASVPLTRITEALGAKTAGERLALGSPMKHQATHTHQSALQL